jgi:lipopolysaccharide transport system ATP-binding protein
MSETVIKVENLSKKYIIAHQDSRERYTALRDVMARGVKNLGKKIISPFTRHSSQDSLNATHEEFYALRDVSFEIKQGDRVGIIGRNGAGKSTLLKILSRITAPTNGRIEITGRVASLLEVGTGFHPELTGRENVFLNGAIMGMSRVEIKRKFDEIVAFAEIEQFLDTPVKRYSSGMYVRLAFAVAAHLESEILLIDEVLAVGDIQFQKKCLGKMEEVGKHGGTVLFVSHNLPSLKILCTNGILLEKGGVMFSGSINDCTDKYISLYAADSDKDIISHTTYNNPSVTIITLFINGSDRYHVHLDESNCLNFSISGILHNSLVLEPEVRIFDSYDSPLAFFSAGHRKASRERKKRGPFNLEFTIRFPELNKGEYFVSLSLTDPGIQSWYDVTKGAKIIADGTAMPNGVVFKYENAGWIMLEEINK